MTGRVEVEAVVRRIVTHYFGSEFVEDLVDGSQIVDIGPARVNLSVVDSIFNIPVIVASSVVAQTVKLDNPFLPKLIGAPRGVIGSWGYTDISSDVAHVTFGTRFLAAGFGTSDVTHMVTAIGQHVTRVGDQVRELLAGSNSPVADRGNGLSDGIEPSVVDEVYLPASLTAGIQPAVKAPSNEYVPKTDYAVHCEILAAFSEAFCQPELHNEELRRKLAERNIDFAITKARSYREESNSKDVLTLDRQRVAESLHALSTLLGFEAADYFVFQDWDDFLEHMEMLEPKSFFHELNRR